MTTDRKRDREATEARVLEAAASLLVQEGAAALGVNALAKAAGCDKQLIYRYFDGIEGVLASLGKAVAARLAAALTAALPAPAPDWPAFSAGLARGLLAAYRADPLLARLRAAEFASPPGALAGFAAERGRVLQAHVAAVRPPVPPPAGLDVAALHAVLTGAAEAAVLSALVTGALVGVSLKTDADWARLEAMVQGLIAARYAAAG